MEFYHVLNRGVDKRKIFLEERDYVRFVHDLFEFNDTAPAESTCRRFNVSFRTNSIARREVGGTGCRDKKEVRDFVVHIHQFCLMPNHYHLLLSPVKKGTIPLFMKKLNMGYSRYFNEKYKRRGTLFQGRYKSVHVANEAHFTHLPYYIHCNPLDLSMPEWRERKINVRDAEKFLRSYRWSSHLDYLGIHNFPSVTQREFLLEYFQGSDGYKESMRSWFQSFEPPNNPAILLE